jgi:DNA-binding CsgD family transcriptional regulator
VNMKLKNPDEVRQLLAEQRGWLTNKEIAEGIKVSENTMSAVLRGMPAKAGTVRAIAEAAGVSAMEIATFVK